MLTLHLPPSTSIPWGDGLCCAHCGDRHVQSFAVTIFDRPADATLGIALRAYTAPHPEAVHRGGAGLEASDDLSENPSDEAGGIRVELVCEACTQVTALEILQHNGGTTLAHKKLGSARQHGFNFDAALKHLATE